GRCPRLGWDRAFGAGGNDFRGCSAWPPDWIRSRRAASAAPFSGGVLAALPGPPEFLPKPFYVGGGFDPLFRVTAIPTNEPGDHDAGVDPPADLDVVARASVSDRSGNPEQVVGGALRAGSGVFHGWIPLTRFHQLARLDVPEVGVGSPFSDQGVVGSFFGEPAVA